MSQPERTLVSVATYNEIENLPRLVEGIFEHAPDVDLLVVDDNSPDGTGAWCDARAQEDPRVHCLHRSGKLGLGTAILAAMRYAVEHGYDLHVNMDADFSHDPKYLPDLLEGVRRNEQPPIDVMVGSRYVPGGGVEGWPIKRYLMSWGVNLLARVLLGLRTRDCSGAFRCYRVSRLAELNFDEIISLGYSFQEEILWRLKRIGCRIEETPITFVDRVFGQSKINTAEAWGSVWVMFKLSRHNYFGRGVS